MSPAPDDAGPGIPGGGLASPGVTAYTQVMATLATLDTVTWRKLAEDIRRLYCNYVVFHADHAEAQSGFLTLWTFHTYVWDLAEATPYVLVTAPTSEAGKSMVPKVARLLACRPYVVADPSPASLYMAIEAFRPTLIIDETDMLEQSKGLRSVLNTGNEPGTPISRGSRSYSSYCPKMFVGITGVNPPLTEMTLSRCIQVIIRRRAPHEKVARFRRRTAVTEAAPLKSALEDWAETAKEYLEYAEPEMPDGLSDRQEDAWLQLFAIADMIGWGEKAREWAIELADSIPKPPDPAVQTLSDVKTILDGWDNTRIPTAVLAKLRNELETRNYIDAISPDALGQRLAAFGIHPEPSPFRMPGSRRTMRGFTIRTSKGGDFTPAWKDAFMRYRLNSPPTP